MEVPPIFLKWFKAFLTNRSYHVNWSGRNFPQGSVSGSLIFVIATASLQQGAPCNEPPTPSGVAHDLSRSVRECCQSIWVNHSYPAVTAQKLKHHFSFLWQRAHRYNMKFANKTSVMLFTRKTGLSGDPRPLSLRLGKKRVPCWEMVKLRDFGVLLDPKLAFSHHVSAVWQKVTHPLPK